jgi:hypothetical protein
MDKAQAIAPGGENTMATMQSEVFEAFRSLNVSDELAIKAASALSKRDDVVNKLDSDVQLLKWMQGVTLAFVIAITLKLFIH